MVAVEVEVEVEVELVCVWTTCVVAEVACWPCVVCAKAGRKCVMSLAFEDGFDG